VTLPAIVFADDAVEHLGEYADASALVVTDANTRDACGERALRALPGASEFVFSQRDGLRAGLDEVAAVRARAARSSGRLVAVGSGVITDVVRYAAHGLDREFVSVPTAASMDGYASGVAAMQIDGVKVTYPARGPVAILADPRVAAAAPAELTRAGLGDLLAKATARVDWLAAHLLYGERFDPEVAERVLVPLRAAASNASRVMLGEADAIAGLLSGLVESGIAMAIFGNSRPASGSEHHASHFWDLLAAQGSRQHASHGLQVGYATRFAMRLQRFAFGGGVGELRRPVLVGDPLGAEARAWLGEPSAEIVAAVDEKQRFIAAAPDQWPVAGDWEAVRARIAPALEGLATVEKALDEARIPVSPGYLGVDEATLRATFRFASRLRARYTVIDLLEGQGLLDDAIEAMLS
jgi:glycerol-1-phosphate dehydrogenase [NAD(P)+]